MDSDCVLSFGFRARVWLFDLVKFDHILIKNFIYSDSTLSWRSFLGSTQDKKKYFIYNAV